MTTAAIITSELHKRRYRLRQRRIDWDDARQVALIEVWRRGVTEGSHVRVVVRGAIMDLLRKAYGRPRRDGSPSPRQEVEWEYWKGKDLDAWGQPDTAGTEARAAAAIARVAPVLMQLTPRERLALTPGVRTQTLAEQLGVSLSGFNQARARALAKAQRIAQEMRRCEQ